MSILEHEDTLKNIRNYEDFINIELEISGKNFEKKKFFDSGLINEII